MRLKSKIIATLLPALSILLQVHPLSAQLSGTYTIDPSKPATSKNYHDFTSAVGDLVDTIRRDLGKSNGPGVSGPVVFNVANGVYYEKLLIPAIKGSSATNTITFQSASGDSSKVILEDSSVYSPFQVNEDYLVELSGTQYFAFKNLSLFRQKGGNVIYLYNHASHLMFAGNFIAEHDNYSSDITDDDGYGEDISFVNNYFSNAGAGIFLFNSTGGFDVGYVIRNNVFFNVVNAIYANNSIDISITGNKISCTTDTSACGISLQTPLGPALVKNNIINIRGTKNLTGISAQSDNFYSSSGLATYDTSRILFADNMISLHDTSKNKTIRGLDFEQDYYTDIIYNTVLIDSSNSSASFPFYLFLSFDNHIRILNNDFINRNGQYAVHMYEVPDTSDIVDYNNYYANNGLMIISPPTGGGKDALINSLKSLYAYEAPYNLDFDHSSISVLPSFVSDSDLHTTSYLLHGYGTPFPGVSDDIDGNPRNKVHPDIGATELNIKHDLGLSNVQSPQNVVCKNTASVNAKLLITNYGANNERNVKVYSKVDGITTLLYTDSVIKYNELDTIAIIIPINIKDSGRYNVQVYINSDSDQNLANDTFTYNIHVISAPKPSFIISNACIGEPVTFTNSTKGDSTRLQYLWTFGDGNQAQYQTASHTFASDSNYITTLKIIDSVGCSDSTSQTVKLLQLTYSSFSFSADKSTVQFTPDSSFFTYYKWDFGDGQTSTTEKPSHTYKQDNTYIVTLYVKGANGCIDSIQELLEIIDAKVGQVQSINNSLSVYPNPFSDFTLIKYNMTSAGPVTLTLFDGLGNQKAILVDSNLPIGSFSYLLSMPEYSPGAYYIRFDSETGSQVRKILYLK